MKKITKCSLALSISLSLGLTQTAYACGACNIKILFTAIPIFIVFYIVSIIYSLVAYSIIDSFMKTLSMLLKLFGVLFLSIILTVGFPFGPIPFLVSTIYCFLVPNRYYNRLRVSNEKEESYIKTKNTLTKTRRFLLLVAILLGVVWQISAIINVSQNPDLLKIHRTKLSNKSLQLTGGRAQGSSPPVAEL